MFHEACHVEPLNTAVTLSQYYYTSSHKFAPPPPLLQFLLRTLGMDESLFKRLEHHSDAVVQLNVQYRMNRWVLHQSNTQTKMYTIVKWK